MKATHLIAALGALSLSANAATIVQVTGITGHDGGNWGPKLGHLTDMVNASYPGSIDAADHDTGMTVNTPDDPSDWTYSGSSWPQEWKANSRLDPGTSSNSKIGYAIFDFGSVVSNLENIYLWNVRSQSTTENVATYNLYYATSPSTALPSMPDSKQSRSDYDFSSGGWTQIGSTFNLGVNSSNNNTPQAIESLGGIDAQYIGLEIITAGGTASRVGLAQVEFTAIPEPSVALLSGLGALMLLRRRKQR